MHVNRLFSDHQRLHEAILYQFLWKKVLAEQASAGWQRARGGGDLAGRNAGAGPGGSGPGAGRAAAG